MRTASCNCGQLTAVTSDEPVRISVCHCLACQRRTGSVFGAQARLRCEHISVNGDLKQFVRVGDDGSDYLPFPSRLRRDCPRRNRGLGGIHRHSGRRLRHFGISGTDGLGMLVKQTFVGDGTERRGTTALMHLIKCPMDNQWFAACIVFKSHKIRTAFAPILAANGRPTMSLDGSVDQTFATVIP